MKGNRAPGEDQIVADMIRSGSEIAVKKIQELFNTVLRTETAAKEWEKCHHHIDIKEGRQERPSQLQTCQAVLLYPQIIYERS